MNKIDLAQVVNNLNNILQISALEGVERTAAYETKLREIYKSPINAPLKELKDLLGDDSKNSININENTGISIYEKTLVMRKELAELLSKPTPDERNITAKWIIEIWGGIAAGRDDGTSLINCVNQADLVDKNDGKVFNFDRIASWSKYLAFKKPNKYAIYDARVIYSLNWLLYQSGAKQYLPFLSGRNSVMELLDYQIYLFFGKDRLHAAKVKAALKKDIEKRREQSVELADSKLTNNSYFSRDLIKDRKLFVAKNDAFSVYCRFLKEISVELFPRDAERLTKTEMLLFAIADAEIAEAVLSYISDLSTTKQRYAIEGTMILDTESDPIPKIYIRELLDSGCSEYESSKLSDQQKLDIINALGLEILTQVLAKCFLQKGAGYNAADEARFAWNKLNGKKNFWEAAYEA